MANWGMNQMTDAFSHPTVKKTPLRWGADLCLGILPLGGGITDILGGLP
jgi:hypothetical protein